MLCTSCGTEAQPGSAYCANCGATLQADQTTESSSESDKGSEPGIALGCLILIRSIFTMPIKSARLAAHELRKIAKLGTIDTDRDFPHLFWCKAMLPVLATVLSASVFLGVLGFAILERGFVGLIAGLVAAVLAAVLADWFIMIAGEYLMIKVVSARYYTQHTRQPDSES